MAPAELEAVLLSHAAVADAGVVGIEDAFGAQERVRAYLQLKPTASVSADEIRRWIEGKVAKHKWLTGVVLVSGIPKSAAGKIQRRTMREWARNETAAGQPKI